MSPRVYLRRTLEERFWEKVDRRGPDECWPWRAGISQGYGRIRRGGRGEGHPQAHHVSWEIAHGPVPEGMWVLHRCDNPPCVNPAHLFLGTLQDNNADRHAKGRDAQGAAHGMAKLTEAQVRLIRDRYDDGFSSRRIALELGVSRSVVKAVVSGDTWRTLPLGRRRPIARKLTAADVLAIRRLRSEGQMYTVIAARFGIDPSYAYRVATRQMRATVAEPPVTESESRALWGDR